MGSLEIGGTRVVTDPECRATNADKYVSWTRTDNPVLPPCHISYTAHVQPLNGDLTSIGHALQVAIRQTSDNTFELNGNEYVHARFLNVAVIDPDLNCMPFTVEIMHQSFVGDVSTIGVKLRHDRYGSSMRPLWPRILGSLVVVSENRHAIAKPRLNQGHTTNEE